jgi:hypothetical protein
VTLVEVSRLYGSEFLIEIEAIAAGSAAVSPQVVRLQLHSVSSYIQYVLKNYPQFSTGRTLFLHFANDSFLDRRL